MDSELIREEAEDDLGDPEEIILELLRNMQSAETDLLKMLAILRGEDYKGSEGRANVISFRRQVLGDS